MPTASFRFARAGDIDDAVKANVDHFLAAINRLRQWTLNFLFRAGAADTNQNAATLRRQVNIFGLPFRAGQKRQKAKRQSAWPAISAGNGRRCWMTISRPASGRTSIAWI